MNTRQLLIPLSSLYKLGASLHRELYEKKILHRIELQSPVISVGNLTVGGTGKTPFVDCLLRQLEEQELRACVLSRGYGRKSRKSLIVNEHSTTADVGDEPLWLWSRHKTAKILVSSDRSREATKLLNVDVFVLDDGLQHHRVKKDFEIALVDATRPLWQYEVLPMGRAREAFSGLSRCDLVVVTRANQTSLDRVDELASEIRKATGAPIVRSFVKFNSCVDVKSGAAVNIAGKNVALVSGIANPESFEAVVRNAGVGKVQSHIKLPDHINYTKEKAKKILESAKRAGADIVLITEKDAVKWREFHFEFDLPISAVCIGLEFDPALPKIHDLARNKHR